MVHLKWPVSMRTLQADYLKPNGEWSTGRKAGFTLGGSRWVDMQKRCAAGGRTQSLQPTYNGVSCDFKSASEFISWARQQVGYENIGWHLDKDILKRGNKVYSPDHCVFVPGAVNCLTLSCRSARGPNPIGVTYRKATSKFVVQLQRNGRQDYLGSYESPEEAFQVYKVAKEVEIKRVADLYRPYIDARTYAALQTYEVNIND